VNPVPRWAIVTTWLLSLVGLTLAVVLTIAHYDGTGVLTGCQDNPNVHTATFNCGLVTTSAESHFLGLPVAVLGLAQFTALAILMSPWAWRSRIRLVALVRFALTAIGMAMVLWLVWAEAVIIKAFCEYCTGVHIVTLALFLVMTRVVPQQLGWVRTNSEDAPALSS
jgi:uncharacterized membrane protein